MKNMDRTLAKETVRMGAWMLLLSALMQALFFAFGDWDYTVLLGNLWGGATALLNFFCMGMTLQRTLAVQETQRRRRLHLSLALRMLMMLALLSVGVLLPAFHTLALLAPVFFPRVIVMLRSWWDSKRREDAVGANEG